MGLTKQEDIWACYDCGDLQGRHDLWFEGDICEKCNEEKQEREFQKEFHVYMKQQIVESNRNLNDYNYK
jgi:hypothetical protein